MYQISQAGLQAIKRFEGSRKMAYLDSAKHLTIGVGHLITDSEKTSGQLAATGSLWKLGLSDSEILRVLEADVQRFVLGVNQLFPKVRLFQHEFDALVSFSFNIGLGAFQRSTMHDLIQEKSFIAVANEFPKWVRAGGRVVQGLVNRRKMEAEMWSNGTYPA